MSDTPKPARVGICAILGLPNAGKSTLLNRVLGVRLAAVSSKPQTTRNRILGVRNFELGPDDSEPHSVQTIYLDTPGLQRGRSALRRYMQEQAKAAAGECDVCLFVVDAYDRRQKSPEELERAGADALAEAIAQVDVPTVLALNKIDRLADKAELLPMIEAYASSERYQEIVPISAERGDGVDRLERAIGLRLPTGPKLFPEEMFTDRAERFLAAELIREQLFRQLGQEVPYATAVEVESWQERRDRGDVLISAVIYVERESQKGIVVGKGGARIKAVGEKARAAISELLNCPAHVRLFVKVKPDWSRGRRSIRELGYE